VEPEIWVYRPNGTRAHGARLTCDCGNVYEAIWNTLKPGGTVLSCGCRYRETRQLSPGRRRRSVEGQSAEPRASGPYQPVPDEERRRLRRDSEPPAERYCTKCKKNHPVREFGTDRRASDGLQAACRESFRLYAIARRQNPSLKDTDNASKRVNQRTYDNSRRARKLNGQVTGPVKAREYTAVLTSGPCVYCGAPATTVDHVTPLFRGGHEAEYNLVPACLSCNSSKGTRLLANWDPIRVRRAITHSEKVAAQFALQQLAA
jgi:5-methylcytosine-specific restriction endonuclease McrA